MDEIDELLGTIKKNPASVTAAPAPAPETHDEVDSLIGHIKQSAVEKEPKPPETTADTPWSEVLTRGAKALPGDIPTTIGEIAGGLGHAIMHPQETAEGIGGLAKGTYDYYAGNETPQAEMAKAVGNELYNSYATEEGWKKGIAERPFSRALDVGSVMVAPEFAAEKMGATGLAKGIKYANPATWATAGIGKTVQGAEKVGSYLTGEMLTHTGGDALNLAREVTQHGSKEDIAAFAAARNTKDIEKAVDEFKIAAAREKELGQTDYRDLMSRVSKTEALDIRSLFNALDEIDTRFGSKTRIHPSTPSAVEGRTAATRQALNAVVEEHLDKMYQHGSVWTPTHDNPWLSPIGMDDLKKKVDDIVHATQRGSEEYAAANVLKSAIDKEIKTNSPIYAKAMARYHGMMDAQRVYDKELSLSGNPDTALRKLFSSIRSNNVLGKYGRRGREARELAKRHPEAKRAMYRLAGASLSSWMPRGLVGQLKAGLVPFGGYEFLAHTGMSPFISIPLLLAQSPRLMSYFARGTGRMQRRLGQIPWRTLSPYLQSAGSQHPLWTAQDLSPFLNALQNAQAGDQE